MKFSLFSMFNIIWINQRNPSKHPICVWDEAISLGADFGVRFACYQADNGETSQLSLKTINFVKTCANLTNLWDNTKIYQLYTPLVLILNIQFWNFFSEISSLTWNIISDA